MFEFKPKLCPFLGKDCVKDECSMWVNDCRRQQAQMARATRCLIGQLPRMRDIWSGAASLTSQMLAQTASAQRISTRDIAHGPSTVTTVVTGEAASAVQRAAVQLPTSCPVQIQASVHLFAPVSLPGSARLGRSVCLMAVRAVRSGLRRRVRRGSFPRQRSHPSCFSAAMAVTASTNRIAESRFSPWRPLRYRDTVEGRDPGAVG
jgi:hypothetical protein